MNNLTLLTLLGATLVFGIGLGFLILGSLTLVAGPKPRKKRKRAARRPWWEQDLPVWAGKRLAALDVAKPAPAATQAQRVAKVATASPAGSRPGPQPLVWKEVNMPDKTKVLCSFGFKSKHAPKGGFAADYILEPGDEVAVARPFRIDREGRVMRDFRTGAVMLVEGVTGRTLEVEVGLKGSLDDGRDRRGGFWTCNESKDPCVCVQAHRVGPTTRELGGKTWGENIRTLSGVQMVDAPVFPSERGTKSWTFKMDASRCARMGLDLEACKGEDGWFAQAVKFIATRCKPDDHAMVVRFVVLSDETVLGRDVSRNCFAFLAIVVKKTNRKTQETSVMQAAVARKAADRRADQAEQGMARALHASVPAPAQPQAGINPDGTVTGPPLGLDAVRARLNKNKGQAPAPAQPAPAPTPAPQPQTPPAPSPAPSQDVTRDAAADLGLDDF